MLKEVMRKERDAITLMMENINGQYDEVLNVLARCQGKIVFMGSEKVRI